MTKYLLNIYIWLISKLAKIYINKSKPIVIGITGSVGKTSCRMIIYQTLKAVLPSQNIYTSPKNFNGEIGTALSIFEIEKFGPNIWLFVKSLFIMIYRCVFDKPKYDIILIEYGIDHIGEMDLQLWIAKPDISIWTGVDLVHAANYPNSDPSYISSEKSKLVISAKKTVFLNKNDDYCKSYIDKISVDLFMFDTSDGSIDKSSNININHSLTWSHNIAYINISKIIADILSYQLWYQNDNNTYNINYDLQAGRYSKFAGINHSTIVDSSYNASPKSTKATIKQFFLDYDNLDKKYILVLWEMRELGKNSQYEHEELIKYIYNLWSKKLEKIILVSGDMKFAAQEAKRLWLPYIYLGDSLTTGLWLKNYLTQNINQKYAILFKSSQWEIYIEESIKYILSDIKDFSKLCRQDEEWIKIKKRQNKIFLV